jgi:hypothetical protein
MFEPREARMSLVRAMAYGLPLVAALATGALGIADWSIWGPSPRDAAPLLWRGIDWLLYPFAMAGLPLLAPTAWIWSQFSPLLTRLIGPAAAQNGALYLLVPGLLFALYLAVRGRSIASGDILRASCAGSAVLGLFGLLSTLSVRGSGDGQAAIGLVLGQNGGLVAGALVAEWILRRGGRREAQ